MRKMHAHQRRRIAHRRCPQHKAAHHRKNRSVRRNPYPDRHHHGGHNPRLPRQPAHHIPEPPPPSRHIPPPTRRFGQPTPTHTHIYDRGPRKFLDAANARLSHHKPTSNATQPLFVGEGLAPPDRFVLPPADREVARTFWSVQLTPPLQPTRLYGSLRSPRMRTEFCHLLELIEEPSALKAFQVQDGQLVAIEKDLPSLLPNWALIKVRLAGICNTELEILRGYHDFRGIPGHEFVGEVISVGDGGDPTPAIKKEQARWIG